MCKHGTVVAVQIGLGVAGVDECLAPFVVALNDGGFLTDASCCGHGYLPPNVILRDGRWVVILTHAEAERLYAQYPTDIHGDPRPTPGASGE